MATISQSDYNKIISEAAWKWYSQSQVDSLAKAWGISIWDKTWGKVSNL